MDERFYCEIIDILRKMKQEEGMRFWDTTYIPLYELLDKLGELFVEKDGKFSRKKFEEEIWRN